MKAGMVNSMIMSWSLEVNEPIKGKDAFHSLLRFFWRSLPTSKKQDHPSRSRKIIVSCPFAYFFRVFLLYLIKHTYFVFQGTKEFLIGERFK